MAASGANDRSATATLLEHAGLGGGETVLDIGSGGGRTAIAAARQVGPDGEVVGAGFQGPCGLGPPERRC